MPNARPTADARVPSLGLRSAAKRQWLWELRSGSPARSSHRSTMLPGARGTPHIRPPDASLPAAHLALPQPRASLAFEVGLSHHLLPTGLKLKFKLKPKLPLPPSVLVNFPAYTGARTLCGRRVGKRGPWRWNQASPEKEPRLSCVRGSPSCWGQVGAAGTQWRAHSSGHGRAQLAVSGRLMGTSDVQ